MQLEKVDEHNAIIIYNELFKNNNIYCLCNKQLDLKKIIKCQNSFGKFNYIYYCSACNFKLDWDNVKKLFKENYFAINIIATKCTKCKTCGIFSQDNKLYFKCDCEMMTLNNFYNLRFYIDNTLYYEDGVYYNGRIIYSILKDLLK